jgi:hypothetical protein
MRSFVYRLLLGLVALFLMISGGYAAGSNLLVDCSNPKAKITTITQALSQITKEGPNTITVSGTCNESVTIDGFEDLLLLTNAGASINNPTPSDPNADVIDITQSRRVTVQGFILNGGADDVVCADSSLCTLNNDTLQGSSDFAVRVAGGSSATLNNDTIENNAAGLTVVKEGVAHIIGGTIAGNSDIGLFASFQGLLDLKSGVQVLNNGTDGADGIHANENSTVMLDNSAITISGSGGNGVSVDLNSVLNVGNQTTITGNGGTGVAVGALSSAFIPNRANVSGNTGNPQAICSDHFSVVRAMGANAALSCSTP